MGGQWAIWYSSQGHLWVERRAAWTDPGSPELTGREASVPVTAASRRRVRSFVMCAVFRRISAHLSRRNGPELLDLGVKWRPAGRRVQNPSDVYGVDIDLDRELDARVGLAERLGVTWLVAPPRRCVESPY